MKTIDDKDRHPKLGYIIPPNTRANGFGGRRFTIKRSASEEISVYIWGQNRRVDIQVNTFNSVRNSTNKFVYYCREDIVCELLMKLSDDLELAYKMLIDLDLAKTIDYY